MASLLLTQTQPSVPFSSETDLIQYEPDSSETDLTEYEPKYTETDLIE